MLQDLTYGKLKNAFHVLPPADGDTAFCMRGGSVLLKRLQDDTLELPKVSDVIRWAEEHQWSGQFRYIFCLQDVNWFLWTEEAGECPDPAFVYEPVRGLRQLQSKDVCFGIMTAWHLYSWYRNNRFCGNCAQKTVHDEFLSVGV